MTLQDQQHTRQEGYALAMRYIANAKDYLLKVSMDEGGWYKNKKYVRTACGIAYNGVLKALGTYFELKNPELFKNDERKTIDFYRENLAKDNKKMLEVLNSAYHILYIDGYCEGEKDSDIIKIGFQRAEEIIDLINPVDNITMTPRMKLMHRFMKYVHDHGVTSLLHEELQAKEERRKKAKARRLKRLAKEIV